jgi:tetratricopeptide (TPR) repeat protein
VARVIALVLCRSGQYALSQGQYGRAEFLLRLALGIAERTFGPADVLVGIVLTDLGLVHKYQGRFDDGDRAYLRAHAIFLAARGEVTRAMADEALLRRALTVFDRIYGAEHQEVAVTLNRLAIVCESKGREVEAEMLYRRALTLKRKRFDEDHPEVATTLDNLAALYRAQGRHAEAEALYQGAPLASRA